MELEPYSLGPKSRWHSSILMLGCSVAFGLVFIGVAVLAAAVVLLCTPFFSSRPIALEHSCESSQAIGLIGIAFAAIGLFSLGNFFFALRARKREKDARTPPSAHSTKSVSNDGLDCIRADTSRLAKNKILIAIIWNVSWLIVIPVVVVGIRNKDYLVLVALTFPCVGAFLAYKAYQAAAKWNRFKEAKLVLTSFHLRIGGKLSGKLYAGVIFDSLPSIQVHLVCWEETSPCSEDEYGVRRFEVGKRRARIDAGSILKHGYVAFEVDIPEDLPACSDYAATPTIGWQVQLIVNTSQENFSLSFPVTILSRV